MSEIYNFSRIRPEKQIVFLGTGKLPGVQSIDIGYSFGAELLNYLGIGRKNFNLVKNQEQYGDININSFVLNTDNFLSYTGTLPFNMYILKDSQDINDNFCLISGYLLNYQTKYSIYQPVQNSATIRFYDNIGGFETGNLDRSVYSQLTGIAAKDYSYLDNVKIPYGNTVDLTLNEYNTNRVLDYTIDISVQRSPIYNLGNSKPKRLDTIYPIQVGCQFTFEASNYDYTRLRDFPSGQQIQDITIKLYDYSGNNLIYTYSFGNMTLISEKYSENSDGNVTIGKSYVGYYYN